MPTKCTITISNPNTSSTDHAVATNEVRNILNSTYGSDFIFEYDTWVQQMFITYGVSEKLVPDNGWDNATKSVTIVLETEQDITGFVNEFFSHDFSVKIKTAWQSNGWTVSDPELS